MKIHRIEFKNINNLKGNHSISFDEAPLSQAGIFAITGPTGSGKSTILDVITLALFNKIPRFKNAANNEVTITKKQILDHGSIMTHHTADASASVVYEINGLKYTSEWGMSKARTGNLRDYEMSLYDASGRPLDLKKSEVPAANEKIIGLNYAQFVKSIILSQGEFSKFLKADKNERGRLLENITGTSIYRKIGIGAFEKEKTVRELLEKEKELLGTIEVLSEEEQEAQTKKVEELQESKRKLDLKLKSLQHIQKIKTDLVSRTQSLYTKKETATSLNQRKEALTPFLKKLDKHDKLSPVQGKLAIYNEAISNKVTTKKNLEEYQIALKKSSADLGTVINRMGQLTGTKVDQPTFKKVMSSFEKEVNDLDRDLQQLRQRGNEERSRINTKLTDYPIQIGTAAKPSEAIDQLQKRAHQLSSVVDAAKIESKESIIELRKKLQKEKETLQLLQELQLRYRKLSEIKSKKDSGKATLTQLEKQLLEIEPKLVAQRELITTLKENIQLLQHQKTDAERIAKLEDLRITLEDGKPCPLCGATDHPYTEHLPEEITSEIDAKISKVSDHLGQKEAVLRKLEKEETAARTSLQYTLKSTAELESENTTLLKETGDIKKMYSGTHDVEIPDLSNLLQELKMEATRLEDGIHALEEIKLNQELQNIYRSLGELVEEYMSKNQKRQTLYQGEDVSKDCNLLQDLFEQNKTSIERLSVSIDKETKDLRRSNNIVHSISKELTSQITALGFNSLTEANDHLLSQGEFEKIKHDKEELTRLITSNSTEISNLKKEIDALSKSDTLTTTSLDKLREDITSSEQERDRISTQVGAIQSRLTRDKEDKKKVAAKQKIIERLTLEFEKWSLLKKMIGDANGNTFANFAQGLTLQNLLVYANRRLKNLSDRYLLDMPTQDGALNIVDLYQGNIQRSVSTLSGGESFLISLALALSLSDMASKNVALDSLFIDEGFGTLDQETLEIAMTTLEKLQSESQKTIGVISHVAALKERINVQIKLEKNAQGYSQLNVVG